MEDGGWGMEIRSESLKRGGCLSKGVEKLCSVVSTLNDNDMAAQNCQVIDASFLPFEACKIKAIPLCTLLQADCLCWPWDKSGEYTVKTGYKILCDEDGFDSASASNNDSIVRFWRCLWKPNIPGKIKHFLWRACTDALPKKTNLLKRKILMDAVCCLCSKEPKSVVHALWSYEVIQVVWKKYFGWLNNGAVSGWSFY